MKKILFSHSYFYKFDSKQWNMAEPYPPLMTIGAAALMREFGYEVQLFDSALKDSPDEILPILDAFNPDYFVIFDDGFNYLTKMCLTTMREAAFKMQAFAKERGAIVITCSSDSTDHFKKYFEHGADYVIKGEGELTLKQLLQNLDSGIDAKETPGIYYQSDAEIVESNARPINADLDQLPQAAWDLIDVESYRKIWKRKHSKLSLNIATTRGCPYKCNWCAKPIYGNRYNTRSPIRVADELEFHINTHGVDSFWMCDDIFGLKPGWVQEFRDEVNRRGLQFKYKIQSRADLLLKEDNIDALVASGLDEVWIGAESGSQKILDAMDKGTTIAQIEESTRLLKSKGVKVAFFIQFGYLGETIDDIDKTLNLVLDLMPDKLGASVSYPLPGTKFYDIVKHDLEKKANWKDSDDLDMMFENTYPSIFYKKLHRYLHARYKMKRGWIELTYLLKRPWLISFNRLKKMISMVIQIPISLLYKYQLNRLSVETK
jgi:anaerobic magnesium-protoporphyrin IX monomethyl ester cyclase